MKPTFARSLSEPTNFLRAARKRFSRCVRTLICAVTLLILTGCGGGNAFTGGGVPIGKATLRGRVVRSEDPTLPLYNALITIVATPQASDTKIMTAITDHNGVFTVTNIPTDVISGPVTVSATPANGAFKAQQVNFRLANNHSASLIFALPPADYTPAIGTTLTISPPSLTLQAGQRVQFTALLSDPRGNPIALMPTLLFDDDFGVLNADGSFTGNGAGTGDIVAFWYNGLKASASVTVQPSLIVVPPAPPNQP